MNQPWIYMCSPSGTPSRLPPHPSVWVTPVHFRVTAIALTVQGSFAFPAKNHAAFLLEGAPSRQSNHALSLELRAPEEPDRPRSPQGRQGHQASFWVSTLQRACPSDGRAGSVPVVSSRAFSHVRYSGLPIGGPRTLSSSRRSAPT